MPPAKPLARPAAAAFALVMVASPAAAPPAAAGPDCAAQAITARGEPASFEWLAKTKARANWRTRVRNTKALGEAYSTWNQADNRVETCTTSPKGGITCTFSANPCHR